MKKYSDIAKRIKETRHPDSEVLLLAGSLIRGEGTEYSDLDIVVLYEKLPKAYRESFIFEGVLVETFVHDPETAVFFMEKVDKPESNSSLAHMFVEGIEVPSRCTLSKEIKMYAEDLIVRGPDKCSEQQLLNMRYAITNLVDDLREYRNTAEISGTLSALYTALSEFYFRANRLWLGRDKYVSRMMKKNNPDLAERYSESFIRAVKYKEIESVIDISEEILKPFGGFLFDGYHLNAGEDMRVKQ